MFGSKDSPDSGIKKAVYGMDVVWKIATIAITIGGAATYLVRMDERERANSAQQLILHSALNEKIESLQNRVELMDKSGTRGLDVLVERFRVVDTRLVIMEGKLNQCIEIVNRRK